ncbi:MAG: IclR family transcriptional regulator [Planctomycetota bacterium]
MSNPRQPNPNPTYPVPALEQGLGLLELVLTSGEAMTQRQIAKRLDKPASTVFRLLACLEGRGYVQRDADTGVYRPTLHLYGLAQLYPAQRRFREVAAGPMRELTETLGESCHLSVLDHGQVRVIANHPSPHAHSLNVRPGSVYPLADASSGKLLLAHIPEDRAWAIVESNATAEQAETLDRAEFMRSLRRLKRDGHCVVPSALTPGVLDVDVYLDCDWLDGGVVLAVPCLKKWSRSEQRDVVLPATRRAGERIAAIFRQSSGAASDV